MTASAAAMAPIVLFGGDGNDFIDGQQGNDVAFLGAGNDVFQWDPGDGSDVVEGQAGTDTMLFNGANVGEIFELSANGDRVRFTRNIAQHHDGSQRRRTRRASMRSAAPTTSTSATCRGRTCAKCSSISPARWAARWATVSRIP